MTANADGSWNSLIHYSAFGEIWKSNGVTPTDYRYTSQLSQVEIGLYYYNARWYDPELGRFVQADTIVSGAENSASYDRYVYVLNNPINGIDPSGHATCDEEGNCYESGKRINNKATLINYYSGIVNLLSKDMVDLSTYKGYTQSNWNDCGPTAAGGGDTQYIDNIKTAYDNHPEWGITRNNWESLGGGVQPSKLYLGAKAGYRENGGIVRRQNNASLQSILVRMIIGDADIFVTDMLANEGYSENNILIGEQGPKNNDGIAHFAQIIGIDMKNSEIYLTDSITHFDPSLKGKKPYWTVSFSEYQDWTHDPENRFSKGEAVNSWLLTIDIKP